MKDEGKRVPVVLQIIRATVKLLAQDPNLVAILPENHAPVMSSVPSEYGYTGMEHLLAIPRTKLRACQ